MLDESAYLETVRTESGVVVAVAYDDDASNDCPLDWIAGHVAVFVVDAPCIETARVDLERLETAADAVANARDYSQWDPDADALKAFTTHYARAGWLCEVVELRGDVPGEWITIALAVEPGYGNPRGNALELEDWAFGHVYRLDFFAPYWYEVNSEVDATLEFYDSLGGVYFADWSDPEAVREECGEYAANIRPPATIHTTVTVTTTGTLATKEADHAQA